MKILTVSSTAELERTLNDFTDDALFRGQTEHYGRLISPEMTTSFDRNGCIPSEMGRWSHYAAFSLAALLGRDPSTDGIEFSQAILQHYGWRSFYLDASTDPAVSAWFAGHEFKNKIIVDMREDCFEDPVWLRRKMAEYVKHDKEGHLYVLSKAKLAEAGIGYLNLSEIELSDCRPRFHVQKAWLVGPLRKQNLPLPCITAYIKGPAAIFSNFASARDMKSTSDLFPPPSEDPVLDILLSLPWSEIPIPSDKTGISIPAFRRSIEIPEYSDEGYRKICSPNLAFYKHEKAATELAGRDGITFYQVPELVMFGSATPLQAFPSILKILEAEKRVVFEIDNLVRLPETGPSQTYAKGLFLEWKDDLIAVSDFVVDHPGMAITGAGMNFAWHYSVEQTGEWTRIVRPDDCPCKIIWRHAHHVSELSIIEAWLNDKEGFADID